MRRIPTICLLVIGVMFVFVGAMHLMVHYQDLVSPELEKALSFSTDVMGDPMDVYRGWQGFSFMMGACFIAIGLLSLVAALTGFPRPAFFFVVLIGLFSAIVYSGAHFFGDMQLYGGGVGIAIALTGCVTSIMSRQP